MVDRSVLFDRASLRADQTIDICSQQAGTFSMHPFWIDRFKNLLLVIIRVSKRLETRLKKSLPSTLSSAVGRKILM